MNTTHLIGRIGQDPEIKTFDWGNIANLSLATTTRWKNKDGERKERTEWHKLIITGPLVQVVEDFIRKGSQIRVTGEIRYREYETDGEKRKVTEIHINDLELLGSKPESIKQNPQDDEIDVPEALRNPSATVADPLPEDDLPF